MLCRYCCIWFVVLVEKELGALLSVSDDVSVVEGVVAFSLPPSFVTDDAIVSPSLPDTLPSSVNGDGAGDSLRANTVAVLFVKDAITLIGLIAGMNDIRELLFSSSDSTAFASFVLLLVGVETVTGLSLLVAVACVAEVVVEFVASTS